MPGENLWQSLQKIATIVHRLEALTEDVRELRIAATSRLEKLESQIADMRERLARIEASREADRAQMQAELARFKVEVERAELRLARPLPAQGEPPALPEPPHEEKTRESPPAPASGSMSHPS
jgi:predicted  nucleic acid-binding Zn-ribbon protein